MLWRDTWAAATTYNINDAVIFQGSSYISRTAGNSNVTPGSDASKWSLLASRGLDGAPAPPSVPAFNLVNSGFSAWAIDSAADYVSGTNLNPTLVLHRGLTYRFNIGVTGHPFRIAVSDGGPAFTVGVTNNDSSGGIVQFKVPMDAPATLHYNCLLHPGMNGTINVQ